MSDGPGSPVLVLNSGSSSVKFALIRPGTGERLMAGMGERLGTPEAVVRLQTFAEPAVSERLPDGSHREAVARVLEHMTAALDGGVRGRGGSPGGARRRAVHFLDPGGRRGYRRTAHLQSSGAAAQPGESRRHRGSQRHTPRLAASRRVRHGLSSDNAAARRGESRRPLGDPPALLAVTVGRAAAPAGSRPGLTPSAGPGWRGSGTATGSASAAARWSARPAGRSRGSRRV